MRSLPARLVLPALLAVTTAAAMTACADGTGARATDSAAGGGTAGPLEGSSWVLAEPRSDAGLAPAVPAATAASLTFEADGRLAGSTGCNRFTGSHQQDGTALTVSLGAVTRVACEGALGGRRRPCWRRCPRSGPSARRVGSSGCRTAAARPC